MKPYYGLMQMTQTQKRPPITVKLYADGNDTGKTATANAAGNWNYSFGRVPKYDDSNREIKHNSQGSCQMDTHLRYRP